jgi:hypothetical protein
MITIRFSHHYCKRPPGFERSILQDAIEIRLEEMSEAFRKYDTRITGGGHYPLPAQGEYLLLMLLSDGGHLWTTIRRSTPDKLAYYRSHIGDQAKCEVLERSP